MYNILLIMHSIFRWLVLLSLVNSIFAAAGGYLKQRPFSAFHNSLRHWTATMCHIQLLTGILLYTQSPYVKLYFGNNGTNGGDPLFFSVLHLLLMLLAITLITVGSAKAKRETTSNDKFKTMLWWFAAGLVVILAAVPWPFSPLAQRPYIRY